MIQRLYSSLLCARGKPRRIKFEEAKNRSIISTQLGFTLVEILVVMLIISITFGFAMLAQSDFGEKRKIHVSAEGFAQFLQVMHKRALLESSTLQIRLNQTGYVCSRLSTHNQWQPLKKAYYRQHDLPKKIKISVIYGGKKLDQLTIVISGSGDMTPFKVYFGTANNSHLVTVIGNTDGTIILE